MIEVQPGTIAVYGDVACPWSHLATYRLMKARERLGLTDSVLIDPRAFPLELINSRPTPKLTLDAETPVAGALEPDAGWQLWQAPAHEWPVTTLPAMEAVQAAKQQGLRAAEALARGLRLALFGQSRCVSIRSVILEVARETGSIDVDELAAALDGGAGRAEVIAHWRDQRSGLVKGSPHVFLADGTDVHNPGIEMHWEGEPGGFPVVDSDDPSVYEDILRRAAATS